jgi:putative acetyltransferase
MEIVEAKTPEHICQVRQLFGEYFRWVAEDLGFDIGYQGVEAELAALPGYYAPPKGRLLLALNGLEAAGCVALRPMEEGACELKRMYVRQNYRGQRLGRALGQAAIDHASRIGYRLVRLDTADSLTLARGLYASLGFREIEPYYEAPHDLRFTLVFMELSLPA